MVQRTLFALVVALPCAGAAGCTSAFVRAGPSYDVGTVGVPGVKGGVGGQMEVLVYPGPRGSGFGVGPALQWGGYATSGDADPIAFTTLEVRARRHLGGGDTDTERGEGEGRGTTGGRPDGRGADGWYWEVGSGVGLAWTPSLQKTVIPLQAEVGWQVALGGSTIVATGIRERLLALVGAGSPPLDAFNSVQLVLGIGYSTGGVR